MFKGIKRRFKQALLLRSFRKDFYSFAKNSQQQNDSRFIINWKNRKACLYDVTSSTEFDRHYIYHTAWAARKIKSISPNSHIDISSSLYFSALVSAWIPIDFYDVRPAKISLDGLNSKSADLLNLPFGDNSIESLSCMHVIEHIGLGRYGDDIDSKGDLKALQELIRVLKPGGHLLIVVPIGKQMLRFNAHRVYDSVQFIKYFLDLSLEEFSLIPEKEIDGGIVLNPSPELLDKQQYGCGCFHFTKRAANTNL